MPSIDIFIHGIKLLFLQLSEHYPEAEPRGILLIKLNRLFKKFVMLKKIPD